MFSPSTVSSPASEVAEQIPDNAQIWSEIYIPPEPPSLIKNKSDNLTESNDHLKYRQRRLFIRAGHSHDGPIKEGADSTTPHTKEID